MGGFAVFFAQQCPSLDAPVVDIDVVGPEGSAAACWDKLDTLPPDVAESVANAARGEAPEPPLAAAYRAVAPLRSLQRAAAPLTSAGWGSFAFRAAQQAKQAQQIAIGWATEAERNLMIATAARLQSQRAGLQQQRSSAAGFSTAPSLRPFQQLCDQVRLYLRSESGAANARTPSALELRRFCGGLEALLKEAAARGDIVRADERQRGLRLYDEPPSGGERLEVPPWPQDAVQMRPREETGSSVGAPFPGPPPKNAAASPPVATGRLAAVVAAPLPPPHHLNSEQFL